MMKKMYVENEFIPLCPVALVQSQFCLPDKFDEVDTTFLTEKNARLTRNSEGHDLADFTPEQQVCWEKEKEVIQGVLESYGVEVFCPRLLTIYEKKHGKESGVGYSDFFSRDLFLTIGNLLVEGNLRLQYRRQETLPIRPVIQQWTQEAEGYYFVVPQPDVFRGTLGEVGPFIEGGDVLVLRKTIFAGCSDLASNLVGIRWLASMIGHFGYGAVPVRLHPHIPHLDCALNLLREDLMIICEEVFSDGLPARLTNWEKIHITLQETAYLMADSLPLNEKTYITDQSFVTLIPQVEAEGIKAEAIDYHAPRMLSGSLRYIT